MQENVLLKIENLTKIYGKDFKGVDNLSLTVNKGEIYGFIGHNGAGKSTTIKSIVGALSFEEGEIFIDGISLRDNPLQAKSVIAYLPDNPELYESLSGINFLNFVGDVFGVNKEKRAELIKKYSALFGLEDNLGDLIASYSHGMKQKLALISALIHEPKLIVMDEPFVGLDPVASHAVKQVMKEFCLNGGAIFFSTHVLEVAEKLCDKIGIIKGGKLVAEGETQKIIGDSSLENAFLEIQND